TKYQWPAGEFALQPPVRAAVKPQPKYPNEMFRQVTAETASTLSEYMPQRVQCGDGGGGYAPSHRHVIPGDYNEKHLSWGRGSMPGAGGLDPQRNCYGTGKPTKQLTSRGTSCC